MSVRTEGQSQQPVAKVERKLILLYLLFWASSWSWKKFTFLQRFPEIFWMFLSYDSETWMRLLSTCIYKMTIFLCGLMKIFHLTFQHFIIRLHSSQKSLQRINCHNLSISRHFHQRHANTHSALCSGNIFTNSKWNILNDFLYLLPAIAICISTLHQFHFTSDFCPRHYIFLCSSPLTL